MLVSEDGEVRLRVVVTVSRHHEGALAWKNQHTPRKTHYTLFLSPPQHVAVQWLMWMCCAVLCVGEEGSVVCLPVLGEGGGACRCVRLFHAYATNDRQDTSPPITVIKRCFSCFSYSLITCACVPSLPCVMP